MKINSFLRKNYGFLLDKVVMIFLNISTILSAISYKYDSTDFTHNVYISCSKKIKKIPVKIRAGNMMITTTFLCVSSEEKGFSFIYPVFTNKIKLVWQRGGHIFVKIFRLKSGTVENENLKNIALYNYYKITFLFNYLFLIFFITLIYLVFKLSLLINLKVSALIVAIFILVSGFIFFKLDIYYIEEESVKNNNFALAYKVFGGKSSKYHLRGSFFYIYPLWGKLNLDFKRELIRIECAKNIFLVYAHKKPKILLKWKNFTLL